MSSPLIDPLLESSSPSSPPGAPDDRVLIRDRLREFTDSCRLGRTLLSVSLRVLGLAVVWNLIGLLLGNDSVSDEFPRRMLPDWLTIVVPGS